MKGSNVYNFLAAVSFLNKSIFENEKKITWTWIVQKIYFLQLVLLN
jgi:hypothetical protein